jgi:NADPH:quinone reductase-like Zn-dependent oxidoreductase
VLVRVRATSVNPADWRTSCVTYSLIEIPEAIRYLEEGHARGKVIITV